MEEFQIIDHYLWIRMPQEVDHHRAGYISKQADHYIVSEKINDIVFDFANTQFMDSSGIAVVINTLRGVTRMNGCLELTGVNQQPMKVIKATGIDKLVKMKE